jgi:hypothetical protein
VKIEFPSLEFDDAVAALCHDSASDEQVRALNELLRSDAVARDAYILRLELHSRLASEPDLFASTDAPILAGGSIIPVQNVFRDMQQRRGPSALRTWTIGLAACLAFFLAGFWSLQLWRRPDQQQPTSKAIAMLNRTVDAQWHKDEEIPRLGAPLDPRWLRLESGLAQVVFYSGARVIIEGPAELQLVSQNNAVARRGRIKADIPPQARGFRVETPQTMVTDLGTSFGLDVKEKQTELHVFKGSVNVQPTGKAKGQNIKEGVGAIVEDSIALRTIKANPAAFASLFDLPEKSLAAEALRYDKWRDASRRLNDDPSLLVHFDFESVTPSGWQLRNLAKNGTAAPDATIVGCQRGEGRWPHKHSMEFQSVSDRVRMSVTGEFESLTLSAWVSVKGLDRKINSLFMSDGFDPGTVHWVIRKDGVLGLTVIGQDPRHHQIIVSPSVLTLDTLGMWMHLAVVLDGGGRVVHYVNGAEVSEKALKITPPFRIGPSELGNWNAKGFPKDDPFMIRNFSGAMDEFCVFGRALNGDEIRALYSAGKPQTDSIAQNSK